MRKRSPSIDEGDVFVGGGNALEVQRVTNDKVLVRTPTGWESWLDKRDLVSKAVKIDHYDKGEFVENNWQYKVRVKGVSKRTKSNIERVIKQRMLKRDVIIAGEKSRRVTKDNMTVRFFGRRKPILPKSAKAMASRFTQADADKAIRHMTKRHPSKFDPRKDYKVDNIDPANKSFTMRRDGRVYEVRVRRGYSRYREPFYIVHFTPLVPFEGDQNRLVWSEREPSVHFRTTDPNKEEWLKVVSLNRRA